MRAIAAREHRRALAERGEARAAHRSSRKPAPSTVRWATKPSRARKAGALDKQIADRSAVGKAGWAQRHPAAAAAERQLRKARPAMLERWKHKNEGTPETHEHASRCNQGALARLYMSGAIDAEQLAAAVEIAEVHERIGADVAVRTASLETRVDVTHSGDGSFYERLGQVRREMAYTRWRREVRGPIAVILEMIAGGSAEDGPAGFTIVAKRYGMHNRKAKRLLIDALDLWPRILGPVCKEIDDATLDAAWAGIL